LKVKVKYVTKKGKPRGYLFKKAIRAMSNGYDNQGRVYSCIINNQKVILVGHKQEQSEDIAYLIKNDPPNLES